MLKQRLRVLYPVLVLGAGGLWAIASSISGFALRETPHDGPISRLAPLTPTPVSTGTSVPGSTDGIMWMGAIIALIILLPIIFSKSTWTKS